MTFLEFLDAMGEGRYRKLLQDIKNPSPLTGTFHSHLIDLLRRYYMVGGMPEAVQHFAETKNALETRKIQQDIIKSYVLDFAKHATPGDIPKLTQIWDSIPRHLQERIKSSFFPP